MFLDDMGPILRITEANPSTAPSELDNIFDDPLPPMGHQQNNTGIHSYYAIYNFIFQRCGCWH
jgi:hypothetical protein